MTAKRLMANPKLGKFRKASDGRRPITKVESNVKLKQSKELGAGVPALQEPGVRSQEPEWEASCQPFWLLTPDFWLLRRALQAVRLALCWAATILRIQ